MVNNFTVEGAGNSLALNMNSDTAPLVVKSDYTNNNQKLTLDTIPVLKEMYFKI